MLRFALDSIRASACISVAWLSGAALFGSVSAAQTAASVNDAVLASHPPMTLPYDSVFKDYQGHKDVKLLDWKASNEAVRAAGGWREYLKQSQAPDAPALAKPSAPIDHATGEGKK